MDNSYHSPLVTLLQAFQSSFYERTLTWEVLAYFTVKWIVWYSDSGGATLVHVWTYSHCIYQQLSESPLSPTPSIINKRLFKNHKHLPRSPAWQTKHHAYTDVSSNTFSALQWHVLFHQTCFLLCNDMFCSTKHDFWSTILHIFFLLTHPFSWQMGLGLIRLDPWLLAHIKQNLAQFLHIHKMSAKLQQTTERNIYTFGQHCMLKPTIQWKLIGDQAAQITCVMMFLKSS